MVWVSFSLMVILLAIVVLLVSVEDGLFGGFWGCEIDFFMGDDALICVPIYFVIYDISVAECANNWVTV